MRDDQDFNIQFVQIIKNERGLYDKTLPEYRSKEEHEKIWNKISEQVNESGRLKQNCSWNVKNTTELLIRKERRFKNFYRKFKNAFYIERGKTAFHRIQKACDVLIVRSFRNIHRTNVKLFCKSYTKHWFAIVLMLYVIVG